MVPEPATTPAHSRERLSARIHASETTSESVGRFESNRYASNPERSLIVSRKRWR
jgi:hypothetical protein